MYSLSSQSISHELNILHYYRIVTDMFDTSFQELGFRVTPLLSFLILHGPFSWKRPIMLELPGCEASGYGEQPRNVVSIPLRALTPPLSQTDRGAVSGLLRASKNQKKMLSLEVRSP